MTNSKTFHTKTLPELHERLKILGDSVQALETGLQTVQTERRNIEDLLQVAPDKQKFDVAALRRNLNLCDENIKRIEDAVAKEKQAKLRGYEMIEEARERDAMIEEGKIEISLIENPMIGQKPQE